MFREPQILSAKAAMADGLGDMALQSSAAARVAEETRRLVTHAEVLREERCYGLYNAFNQIEREQVRALANPFNQVSHWAMEAAHQAWIRKKEAPLWIYRRTMGLVDRARIKKAVNREIERLFPSRIDPRFNNDRIPKFLVKQNSIVKVHSPPVLLFPKTLHPIDSVA
jgi:hypothetical protein